MSNNIYTYSITFPDFSLDFDVDYRLSADMASEVKSHDSGFVFAVAETWLRIKDSRYLLESRIRPGNFIEELKEFSEKISNPTSFSKLENIIPCGGWSTWMSGYWDRLCNDCGAEEDERNYELLRSLSLLDSPEGYIAIYKYNGIPVIEASTRVEEGKASIMAHSTFDPEKTALYLIKLRQSMKEDLLQRLKTS